MGRHGRRDRAGAHVLGRQDHAHAHGAVRRRGPGEAAHPCGPDDPARVLRELEAKQAPLEEHHTWEDGTCRTCCEAECPRSPRTTLRLLAVPYAGHPGYDDSWRP
ncbi:DUF6221 family protein [Streptomyces sp. NPDC052107]|uniref:DUF6221 family protein n=1 Tax=Streptomyces sp. NPDC052107 TaxID=3155632 RepID=UPI00341865E9